MDQPRPVAMAFDGKAGYVLSGAAAVSFVFLFVRTGGGTLGMKRQPVVRAEGFLPDLLNLLVLAPTYRRPPEPAHADARRYSSPASDKVPLLLAQQHILVSQSALQATRESVRAQLEALRRHIDQPSLFPEPEVTPEEAADELDALGREVDEMAVAMRAQGSLPERRDEPDA